MQFRSFMWKTLELITDLNRKDGSLQRFLLASLPIMGARGTVAAAPAMALIAYLMSDEKRKVTKEDIEVYSRNLAESVGLGDVPGATTASSLLTGGIPGALGFDVSQSAGFGEFLTPFRRVEDIAGPAGADLIRLARALPAIYSKLTGGQPLTRDEQRALADFRASVAPSLRRGIQTRLTEGLKGPLEDPRTGQPLLSDPTLLERAGALAGAMPSRLADVYGLTGSWYEQEARAQDIAGGYRDTISRLILSAQQAEPEERARFIAQARQLAEEAAQKGTPVSPQSLHERVRQLRTERLQWMLGRAPRSLKPHFAKQLTQIVD